MLSRHNRSAILPSRASMCGSITIALHGMMLTQKLTARAQARCCYRMPRTRCGSGTATRTPRA